MGVRGVAPSSRGTACSGLKRSLHVNKSRRRKDILWFIRSVQQMYDYIGLCVLVLNEFPILKGPVWIQVLKSLR